MGTRQRDNTIPKSASGIRILLSLVFCAGFVTKATKPTPAALAMSIGLMTTTWSESRDSQSLRRLGYDLLVLLSEAANGQLHAIPRTQVNRWLPSESHAGRRSGGDDIAGSQAHEPAHVAN